MRRRVIVDVEEFERFFELMRPRLLRSAMRHLDADSANDMAIATLHTIWTKDLPAPTTRAEQLQLQALAHRVLDGHVRNAQRGAARRARLERSIAEEQLSGTDTEPDVALHWARGEDQREVDRLLGQLPPHEREVVVLVMDGFKVNEIAEILGKKPGAISMRLARARQHLKELLEGRNRGDA